MAKRKSHISIDFSQFTDYAAQLEKLNADLKKIFSDAMEQAAETIENDTVNAMKASYLPAHGKYQSKERWTEQSIIHDAKVKWDGPMGEIGLGFDKTKRGSGGFLITGTPKMRPDRELARIYSQKKYEAEILKDIREHLQEEINERLGN